MHADSDSNAIAHATIRSLHDRLKATIPLELCGLEGGGGAYVLSTLIRDEAPLIIIAPDQKSAERLWRELCFFARRSERIHLLPHWEAPPYSALRPHPEVEATRITTLEALRSGGADVVVLPARALIQRMIPPALLGGLGFDLILEDEYPRDELLRRLVAMGYHPESMVEERGSFSARGDIVDLFPPTGERPLRIEFFGDWIERMRYFDLDSQRTLDTEVRSIRLLPVREAVLGGEQLEAFTQKLRDVCIEQGLPRTFREEILSGLRDGLHPLPPSILLALTCEQLAPLDDYLDGERWIVADPAGVAQEADAFLAEIREAERHQKEGEAICLPADRIYDLASVERLLTNQRRIELSTLSLFSLNDDRYRFRFTSSGNADLRIEADAEGESLKRLAERLREWQREEWQVAVVCHHQPQVDRLLELLAPYQAPLKFHDGPWSGKEKTPVVILGEIEEGFRLPEEKLAVISEAELFGGRVRRRRGEKRIKNILSSLSELRQGDLIVHIDHGIGRYHGLEHIRAGEVAGDYLHLEYYGGDKLYLPVDRIEKVQKYFGGGGDSEPKLDKMGGIAWEKAKLKAKAATEELARELLKTLAQREMREGFKYSEPDRLYREFEAAFPYEETPDQLGAIQDVINDMTGDKPMDRLVCGDVGFGKTEVAIRAAFKAVLDGRQVAVLVPTTVLAKQHFATFCERLKEMPVKIDMVSRFRSPAEQKKALAAAVEGKVDILIGTHRLLQRDVGFKDLGLVIIDEEQRFGVRHKEQLKRLRAEVDVLTLTATPIPRTLHMSMVGLRSLSVIETAPVDRQVIRTYVSKFDEELIRSAVQRELRRGGQVFFVHNRVQSIGGMADYLREILPGVRIAVGHGQMPEKDLEQVMVDFIDGKADVLVASTIIENGIDIPRANTIIINRADCFGLSQLYQLRGRIGRSKERAYAYLLIPGEATLTATARERLRVLEEMDDLGGGFRIASHDLELRGAGELLGGQQSGQIAAVGFEMYNELLEETITELKGMEREEKIDPEIRLGLSAYLPEKYIPDPNQRLVFYKRMAAAESDDDLYDTVDELQDRYGSLPEEAKVLLESMKLRVMLKALRIELAEYDGHNLVFGFHATTSVSPDIIMNLLQKEPGTYSITPDYRMRIKLGRIEKPLLLERAKKELHLLQ